MNREQAQHLLDAATATREAPNPTKFTMAYFAHDRETPACVLGHYAVREDLQDRFSLTPAWFRANLTFDGTLIGCGNAAIQDWFGLTSTECCKLFDEHGCGNAALPDEAAQYIENFLADRGWYIKEE